MEKVAAFQHNGGSFLAKVFKERCLNVDHWHRAVVLQAATQQEDDGADAETMHQHLL